MTGGRRVDDGGVRAYIRVSSRAQDYDMQAHAIERCARARGDEISHWYREKRHAKNTQRPELQAMLDDAKRGQISRLYVYRLDRLSRSGIRDTIEIVQELRRRGCSLVTVGDGFELDGPASDLVLCVLAWAAQFEGRAIGERVARSREQRAEQGLPWGKAPRMGPELLARAREMRSSEGRSIRQIAVALKIPRAIVGRAVKGLAVAVPIDSPQPTPPKPHKATVGPTP